jgi:hypothetical protein
MFLQKGDTPVSIEEDAQTEDEVQRLKNRVNSLSRQLHEVKHKRSDYLSTVWEAVQDSLADVSLQPVKAPKKLTRATGTGAEEICVPLLSDLQTGKVTPDYNTEICRERVMRYAEKIVRITEIQRADHPVRHCVVPMLGDMIEGVDIFPGQQWLIDSTLYAQVFNSTPSIVVDFLRYLLAHFDTVTVEAVDGNHGRIGRKGQFGPEDNADKMVYRIAQLMTRDEPRLTWNITDYEGERSWYRIMQLGNYKALLIHGDQIRGSMGFPWYGLGKKVHSWGSGGLGPDSDFQDVMMGHYHSLARVPLNHRSAWANGSTESTNTFAAEVLAAQSRPTQWLLFVEPAAGRVTASYGVELS